MKFLLIIFIITYIIIEAHSENRVKYTDEWKSLDARPLPKWYDEAKIGIFIHWGVFSVPAYESEWFWWYWKGSKSKSVVDFMNKNYKPGFTYADFGPKFTAEFYDPNQWADILKSSGAQYVVLTSKHHEGFCNWPSKVSFNWNSMQVGPKRDLVGDLAKAIRNRTRMHFGLYHSMFEWFNPEYLEDKRNNYSTNNFVQWKTIPELKEIVNAYKPELIWSDGSWEVEDSYWQSRKFLQWLYNESPVRDTIVVNDRWGSNTLCKHGGYFTCHDKFNPGTLQPRKWENAMTIDKGSWGYRRNAKVSDFLTMHQLLTTVIETVSCGGNILINIGPTHDGIIPPLFEQRLRDLGTWLGVNGEAIYKSKPWTYQNDTITKGVWYTSQTRNSCDQQQPQESNADDPACSRQVVVYALLTSYPANGFLFLGSLRATPTSTIQLLGYRGGRGGEADFKFDVRVTGTLIMWPQIAIDEMPCEHAWVLRITDAEANVVSEEE